MLGFWEYGTHYVIWWIVSDTVQHDSFVLHVHTVVPVVVV